MIGAAKGLIMTRSALADANMTLNPLDKGTAVTLSNNNLTAAGSGVGLVRGTSSKSTGKWIFEVRLDALAGSGISVGLAPATAPVNSAAASGNGFSGFGSTGKIIVNGNDVTSPDTPPPPAAASNILTVAWDADAHTLQVFKNGSGQVNTSSLPAGIAQFPCIEFSGTGQQATANFTSSLVYPQSGYLPWVS